MTTTYLTGPTPEMWKLYQLPITRLYIGERKPLKEVMQIMSQQGFHASPKMYKDRITAWKLRKNARRSGDLQSISKRRPPPQKCKTTRDSFRISRSLVGHVGGEIKDSRTVSDNTLALVIANTRVQRSPSLPRGFSILEELLHSITAHYAMSIESGIWIFDEAGYGSIKELPGLTAEITDPEDFGLYCSIAISLRNRGLFLDFRRQLAKAFRCLKSLLQTPHPKMLQCLFQILLSFRRAGLIDVTSMLCRYIDNLAMITTSTISKPWYRVLKLIAILDDDNVNEAILRLWLCTTETFERHTGVFGETSLECRLVYMINTRLGDAQGLLEFERLLRKMSNEIPRSRKNQSYLVRMYLAYALHTLGKYSEMESLGLETLLDAQNYKDALMEINAMDIIARSQNFQNKIEEAEATIKACLDLAISEWGASNPRVHNRTSLYEGWLREWGREEEADKMRAQISEWIGEDETDLEQRGCA